MVGAWSDGNAVGGGRGCALYAVCYHVMATLFARAASVADEEQRTVAEER